MTGTIMTGLTGIAGTAHAADPAWVPPHKDKIVRDGSTESEGTKSGDSESALERSRQLVNQRWPKKMVKRFAREVTRPGDRDASPTNMKHVRELQYRLKWVGTLRGPVDGIYGPNTRKAVKKFQQRHKMKKRNGVANRATWRKLIKNTIQAKKKIPASCRQTKWAACYDRTNHQVVLLRKGKIWNSWLVRGGAKGGLETDLGTYQIYYRNIDHVSSQFDSPMPYSQFFHRGEAFHGSPTMIDPYWDHSHGCINMYVKDARQLWALVADKNPVRVVVYGKWS